jgi:CheY-like chemotaxis protein
MKKLKKVLVIDDSEIQLFMTKHILLKNYVCECVEIFDFASSALEYLNSIQDRPGEFPEMILLDVSMPEMDGFGFLERYPELSHVLVDACSIVMLTSSTNKSDHERAMGYPYVKGYLNKPFGMESLEALVESLAA